MWILTTYCGKTSYAGYTKQFHLGPKENLYHFEFPDNKSLDRKTLSHANS